MSKLRLGLIGAGGMGMALANAAKAREDTCFVGVADPSEEAARKAAAELGGTPYAAYADLLARDDLDAVIVAPPNTVHCEAVVAAAAAGKHIFAEKPMAMNVAECDTMITAADRAGVKLMVGQVLRLIPGFAKARELVLSGELGRPLAVAIERSGFWGRHTGWRSSYALTGGFLFEVNVHELDYMRAILGEAKSVYAAIPPAVVPGSDIPGINFVTVQFHNGGVGLLNSNMMIPQGQYQVCITCERGSVRCDWGSVSYQEHGGELRSVPSEEIQGMVGGVPWEINSFVEWVLYGTPPVVTAADGRAAVEIAQAAVRSGETGQVVPLPLQ